MANVLQLTKVLRARPQLHEIGGFGLRPYQGPHDIENWLDLRRRAFAKQKVGIRDWNEADFEREFLAKTWWRPSAMWFAECRGLLLPAKVVGTVTLARRGEPPEARPVVHWLCVSPAYRRQGVGKMLLTALEGTVWDAGERQVWLETHVAWAEALRLYEALGYVRVEPAEG
jgi:ribosomal protein S18 acetylase RimI-like enzyme